MKNLKLILFIPLLIIVAVVIKFLTVSTVNIHSPVSCVSSEKLKKDLMIEGKHLLLINYSKIEQELIRRYSCLKRLSFKFSFPSTMDVELTSRTPLFNINPYQLNSGINLDLKEASVSSQTALINWEVPNNAERFLADEDGVIFEKTEDLSLPVVFVEMDSVELGKKVEKNLSTSLVYLVNYFKKLQDTPEFRTENSNFEISNMYIKQERDLLLVYTRPKTVFSLKDDILKQLASLQLILGKAKIDEKIVENIDLRFDKPIVIYAPKKKN